MTRNDDIGPSEALTVERYNRIARFVHALSTGLYGERWARTGTINTETQVNRSGISVRIAAPWRVLGAGATAFVFQVPMRVGATARCRRIFTRNVTGVDTPTTIGTRVRRLNAAGVAQETWVAARHGPFDLQGLDFALTSTEQVEVAALDVGTGVLSALLSGVTHFDFLVPLQ